MLADGLRVAQIVMLLDQAVEQRFLRSAADLLEPQRHDGPQVRLQGRLIDFDCARYASPREWIRIDVPYRWQFDATGAMQRQHQPAADHIARAAIWLYPVPRLAQLLR